VLILWVLTSVIGLSYISNFTAAYLNRGVSTTALKQADKKVIKNKNSFVILE